MGKANKLGVGLKALSAFVWTLAGVLSALTLLTTTVVALRIGNFLPEDMDVVFLVPKDPSFEVSDGENNWTTNTTIDMFSTTYVNEKGEVIAESQTGEAILMPGVKTDYTFKMANNGNMAIDYNVVLDFDFLHNGNDFELDKLPLVARVYSAEDKGYIVGADDKWIPLSNIADEMEQNASGTLGINSYNEYRLELMWPYHESAEADARDTLLGGIAASGDDVEFNLSITTLAEQSLDPSANGGIVDENEPTRPMGGAFDPLPFAALVTLTALSGAAFATAAAALMVIKAIVKTKAVVIPPAPVVPKQEETSAPPPAPEAPKPKRKRKKRIINQHPGRWQNHKKLTNRKKRRSKKRRLGL